MSSNENNHEYPFVSWKLQGDGILVSWSYQVYHKRNPERISGCIPALGIYFSAKDEETFQRKESAMAEAFFDNFFLHNGANGLKKLIVELSKRGFVSQTNSNFIIHRISKKDIQPTKFKAKNVHVPEIYEGSTSVNRKMKREVALA